MRTQTVTLRILRFKPDRIETPHYEDFKVRREPRMTVLDGLEQIRLNQDETLMYRHCCHHSSCGTCACTINGNPALACASRIADLQSDVITVSPLANHTCLGDLAVDMTSFFREMDPHWTNIRPCEGMTSNRIPEDVDQVVRLENCIECGCCVATCPVSATEGEFRGPTVLAAINNEIRNRPTSKQSLLRIANDARGVFKCQRHLVCSRVCPTRVYPARHIADLQRALDALSSQDT